MRTTFKYSCFSLCFNNGTEFYSMGTHYISLYHHVNGNFISCDDFRCNAKYDAETILGVVDLDYL